LPFEKKKKRIEKISNNSINDETNKIIITFRKRDNENEKT